MNKDFYLEQKSLASYFEKEWLDVYLNQSKNISFEYAEYNPSQLYSQFNEKVASFILKALNHNDLHPENYLEIGPGFGRTFYEVGKACPDLKKAILVEPSRNLHSALEKIFSSHRETCFHYLKGMGELAEITLDTTQISEDLSHISKTFLNKSFQEAQLDLPESELVVCLNVLDQCKDTNQLLDLVTHKTATHGILAISCTFQWQKKYLGLDLPSFKNLKTPFAGGWKILAELNEPFHVKLNERCWYTFLPQVLILQKL